MRISEIVLVSSPCESDDTVPDSIINQMFVSPIKSIGFFILIIGMSMFATVLGSVFVISVIVKNSHWV
jgi:hypothetical protein